jgi:N-acyl-L-homoserine lactone synthetase
MVPVILPPSYGRTHLGRIAFERFRHEHYCVRRGYEPTRPDQCETDEYDSSSTYIIVVEDGIIFGGCRLIPSFTAHQRLPLEREYKGRLNRPTYEVSRMLNCIDAPPNTTHHQLQRLKVKRFGALRLLYSSVHEFLEEQQIESAYAVVEQKFVHCLQHDFSEEAFVPLGDPYEVTHGVRTFTHVAMQINVANWARCYAATLGRVASKQELIAA